MMLSRRRGVIAGIIPPDPDPGPAGLTIVGVESRRRTSSGGTLPLDIHEDTENGDLLVARVAAALTADEYAAPSGWDIVRTASVGGSDLQAFKHRVFSRIADDEPASYDFVNGDNNSQVVGEIIVIRGHGGIDVHDGSLDTSTLPVLSPNVEDGILLGLWGAGRWNQTATWTDPDDMTTLVNDSPNVNSRPAIVSAWEQLEGDGDTPARTSTKGGTVADDKRSVISVVIAPAVP